MNSVGTAVIVAAVCVFNASGAEVQCERWTRDFTNVLELARSQQRPLITVVRNEGCPFCDRMDTVLKGALFNRWLKDTGIYLAEVMVNETNSCPAQFAAFNFVAATMKHEAGGFSFPMVGVYWQRGSNDVVRTSFVGRRAMMPGADAESRWLSVQFVSSLDSLIGGYTAGLSGRVPCKELLSTWDRKVEVVKVAAEGPGTVSVSPEDGVMVGVGSLVRIHARPQKGMKLIMWRGPNGIKVSRSQNQKVLYEMGGGTYTAVFGPSKAKAAAEKED